MVSLSSTEKCSVKVDDVDRFRLRFVTDDVKLHSPLSTQPIPEDSLCSIEDVRTGLSESGINVPYDMLACVPKISGRVTSTIKQSFVAIRFLSRFLGD